MSSNTVTLSQPLKSIDKVFTELTVREPTGTDLEAAGDPATMNSAAYSRRLGEILCGLVPDALKAAPARDIIAIGKIVNGFLADPPPTPSTDTSSAPAGGDTASTASSG